MALARAPRSDDHDRCWQTAGASGDFKISNGDVSMKTGAGGTTGNGKMGATSR